MAQIRQAAEAIRTGNADAFAEQLAKNNPAFAQFLNSNRGKTTEQILHDNGVNAEDLRRILSMLK